MDWRVCGEEVGFVRRDRARVRVWRRRGEVGSEREGIRVWRFWRRRFSIVGLGGKR